MSMVDNKMDDWINEIGEELPRILDGLNDTDLAHALMATRIYTFHFDTYLRSMIRGVSFPFARLLNNYTNHGDEVDLFTTRVTTKEIIEALPDYAERVKNICDTQLKFPIDAGEMTLEGIYKYSTDINTYIQDEMVPGLLKIAFHTSKPLMLFRGLNLSRTNAPDFDIQFESENFTSYAYDVDSALQFATGMYGKDRVLDLRIDTTIIMSVEIPENIVVIPVGMCTIQDEGEMVILNSGTLVKCGEWKIVQLDYWNPFINARGRNIVASPTNMKKITVNMIDVKLIPNDDVILSDFTVGI